MRIFILLGIVLSLNACQRIEKSYHEISGSQKKISYLVTAETSDIISLQKSIDSLLVDILSTYDGEDGTSTISNFNESDSLFCWKITDDPYFEELFSLSKSIYQMTDGAFNPSIAPLVKFHGSGYQAKKQITTVDSIQIKELAKLMMLDSLCVLKGIDGELCMRKPKKELNLDFNGLADGYCVDKIASYFKSKGITNYFIKIGTEMRALGLNSSNQEWFIGINEPTQNVKQQEKELPLLISNKAIATSGNYKNAIASKGQRYAYIINPYTGFREPTDILSVTVIANDCVTADGLATAFLALGLEKSLALIKQLKGVDACFIYDNEGDGIFEFKTSEGFSKYYLHNEQNN